MPLIEHRAALPLPALPLIIIITTTIFIIGPSFCGSLFVSQLICGFSIPPRPSGTYTGADQLADGSMPGLPPGGLPRYRSTAEEAAANRVEFRRRRAAALETPEVRAARLEYRTARCIARAALLTDSKHKEERQRRAAHRRREEQADIAGVCAEWRQRRVAENTVGAAVPEEALAGAHHPDAARDQAALPEAPSAALALLPTSTSGARSSAEAAASADAEDELLRHF